MTDDAYRQRTAAFAAMLLKQAAWPAAVVIAGDSVAPLVASARGALQAPLAVLALLVAAGSAVAVLGLSALLLFDALLFRLMATHDNEVSGGAAVDDLLARMRLKPAPSSSRTLDDRIAGTRRLLARQRVAFAIFVISFLTAGFWMPR
ncbi:hypothetical protein EN836_21030 [Mesorhizobium sp. M1C.F.Ca.ET.193.01.1.1]|uniref:hypothetical protein n=1 Tax=unclassified Mesorhizobium TaxID=325217 RepID=UPI000FD493F6|nr:MULTISPECIES: hypothetical protein [unclassified Mesorhizobium]TGS96363.1 hypothetical protein EN820_41710 [bacterium M00.F.Ca.ET.177.01.1.1]TGQ52097.1 hypothetical protein EN853_21020 [Mesorhizobium sp. M1C.F.Ca.ET.210.01.1.1]TGQ68742.1 hypothetical protein EN855_021030 [Mesorhizobium sp. M1C.F.Ca.ET.212.01.1.1]TGR04094.1 hypothetical protein EN847_20980 [Mesorhizobium sp. M1C.F.Ca.ET.204.01.1.1]TGR24758.1 hypothetical protein EN839_20980 [Mesorhizobium sp. M1C.F.Ca.ET.196.01.1.1]